MSQVDRYVFSADPVLGWAYLALSVCHFITSMIVWISFDPVWQETLGSMKDSSRKSEADDDGELAGSVAPNSIAGGLTTGYDAALLLNLVLWICYWTSVLEGWDGLDLIAMEGFLVAFLPAIGALASAAWQSNLDTVAHHEKCLDEEMGRMEKPY